MKQAPKKKTAYFCTNCGSMHHRWQGQCKDCEKWNCLHEEVLASKSSSKSTAASSVAEVIALDEVTIDSENRLKSSIEELDRVLGGGAVVGSAVLIGGEPGIGKSTLLLQAADKFGQAGYGVLYVSGEESVGQIKDRAGRFGITGKNISVVNESELEKITNLCDERFQIIMIDSIQTLASSAFDSPPGTVGQVRESSSRLIEIAKKQNKVLFLIGHITKDGSVAGPKVLEHMVDAVLYFEGDRQHLYRLLRSQKNRFGPSGEIGVFEMTGRGLEEIKNPSRLFYSADQSGWSPGRVVTAAAEGSRSFLIEVESLVATSPYGTPQRVASGIDAKRLAIICAVLEKRGGLLLGGNDVFVNIAGGLRIDDIALDLAFLLAAASSKLNQPVPADMLILGEVGLSGEIRGVTHLERRLTEAVRLGIGRAMIPKPNMTGLSNPKKMEIIPVANVDQALEQIR